MNPVIHYDRRWFIQQFETLFSGWYRTLKESSPSSAVWESTQGFRTPYFLSRSGKLCAGVTRMMPGLAAWAAQSDNPPLITLATGQQINPRHLLRDMFVHAMDPQHTDFWQYAPPDRQDQRQVESSIVAWSLWLSRDWLLPMLSKTEIENIQQWLASCTQYNDLYSNWSMFTAVNLAVRIALAEHGFTGDFDALRRHLIPGEDVALGDGWMWDVCYYGIDYYNFWVWGSHHCYLKAILPRYENPMLARALQRVSQRLEYLPYLIDARGRNVLFGRSLPYRWGWLSGAMAAQFAGIDGIAPGLLRHMFAKNLTSWIELGSLNEEGLLRERLTATGSKGAHDSYINCGDTYWGMQAFLCLALPDDHVFWTTPMQQLPIEQCDFQIPCQGPGLVFEGFQETGEVRLFNLRNLNYMTSYAHTNALYHKFVYSTAFPCNCDGEHHATLWDNQFGLLLADGTNCLASKIMEVDTFDGHMLRIAWRYKAADFEAVIHTTLHVDGEIYQSSHEIIVNGTTQPGARWIEGGFTLGHHTDETPQSSFDINRGWAELHDGKRMIFTKIISGWKSLRQFPDKGLDALVSIEPEPNILYGRALHYYIVAPVQSGRQLLVAQHGASLSPPRFKKLCGLEK